MSPRSADQFEEMRNQSREAILDAAMELFATQGFHNTSISQITKKAGVSKGLVYNYFEKKEDLMKGIMMRLVSEGEHIWLPISREPDPKKRLILIIDATFDYISRKREYVRLMTGLALQMQDFPELEDFIKVRYTQELPVYATLLEEIGIPHPREEAILIAAMLDGIGMQSIVLGDAYDLDGVRHYLLNRYQLIENKSDNIHSTDKNSSI